MTQQIEIPYSIISPSRLKEWLEPHLMNNPATSIPSNFIIIDVRGSDFKYGKIPTAINVPCKYFNKYAIADLLQKYPVSQYAYVFHCMRSQNRGPRAARKFCEYLKDSHSESVEVESIEIFCLERVFLLEGGLKRWNELYGDTLIEELHST